MIARDLRHHLCAGKDIALTCASLLRPREQMLPSQFASRYRYLKEGTTERPGLWSNDHFPYLVDVMDAALEAIQAGKNLVLMKSAQGGGSEAIINVCCFLLEYFPGPLLYLISKDELAAEFGRERVGHIVDTCEPLKRKAIRGKGKGDLIKTKRFADGKWSIMGSGSVLNLQSLPYRIVVIDEYDSMLDEMEGHGDPLKLAEARTGAFSGRTLVIVFAHPSTRERGAGKIYYEESDQRRGHVKCPHCGNEFWLSWSNFRCIPKEGMTKSQAERDPNCYQYFAPCCGVEISDGQRWMMARNVRQKSVLAPAVAKEKKWIGVHFGKQYMPHKTTAQLIAEDIESQGDSGKRRVFVNKTMGDVYEAAIQETDAAQWRRLKVLPRHDKDNEFYVRGQVPSGVRFLTAGQDSRSTELHWAIWGWGLLPDESNYPILCRWLIDYGVVKRTYSLTLDAAELRVFDQILYERSFPSVCGKYQFWVEQGFHDSSWQPVAVYQYCRLHPFRAFPIKGGSVEGGRDVESKAPRLRWGAPPVYRINGEEVKDENLKLGIINTYTIKEDLFALVNKSFKRSRGNGRPAELQNRIILPDDVDEDFLSQSSAETLVVEGKKKVWKRKGQNHLGDCNVYADAAAHNLDPFQGNLSFDEVQAAVEAEQSRNAVSQVQTDTSEKWLRVPSSQGSWISRRD